MKTWAPKLLCPFCGCVDSMFNFYLADGWIECLSCDCQGPHNYSAQTDIEKCEAVAISLWNKRDSK